MNRIILLSAAAALVHASAVEKSLDVADDLGQGPVVPLFVILRPSSGVTRKLIANTMKKQPYFDGTKMLDPADASVSSVLVWEYLDKGVVIVDVNWDGDGADEIRGAYSREEGDKKTPAQRKQLRLDAFGAKIIYFDNGNPDLHMKLRIDASQKKPGSFATVYDLCMRHRGPEGLHAYLTREKDADSEDDLLAKSAGLIAEP